MRQRSRQFMAAAVGFLLAGGGCLLSSCDQYDLDERTPDGWGSSIYSWLDEAGNYRTTVNIIDDLGYREVLAKTGSKTLFVADDAAFDRFYQLNRWGVKSYRDLTTSQKKLLLFGSMMDNSMQLGSLSSVEGDPPREGEAMRRFASSTPYDSVAVITPDQMPDNPYWRRFRDSGQPIVCMTDNTTVPLVQFIEKQLVNRRITNDDYDFIYNKTTHRQPGDASVNSIQVEQPNIKCSNGFIHKMEQVILPLPNMAELIKLRPVVSKWNKLLERYCAPYPLDLSYATQYNYLYDANIDTLYQKRFFSEKSQDGQAVNMTPDRRAVNGKLKFDPEWNAYYAGNNDQDGNIVMQRDMAVMMVPSNDALDEYWNDGAGKVLRDYYGTWDNVPDDVISELINNNMLSSFVNSVPSKFDGILNDANDPMGVSVEAIDSVWLACNGAIYLTNQVYSPTAYVSVSFPALVNETMRIIYWGIKQLQYNVYLNSMNSYYSFFIPTNDALKHYIDPCSYGKNRLQTLHFHYDPSKPDAEKVWASVWNIDPETGEEADSVGIIRDNGIITNRLKDILDTHIVIGNVEDGHEYYRTKGGTEIRVANAQAGANGMKVLGSLQENETEAVPVSYIYDQSPQTNGIGMGNGKSYVLDEEPIMGTRQTVRDVLEQHEEFSKFLELMDGSGLFEMLHLGRNATAGQNISVFNTYHYTIYVPTNESIEALQRAGKLSSWEKVDEYEQAGNLDGKTRDSLQIVNFLKYHIQDNALFIGAEDASGDFETSYSYLNNKTWAFYRVNAKLTSDGITIRDHAGNVRNVVTTNPHLFNLMAREYQYDGADASRAVRIETSSSAVIHLIDQPLLIEN